MGTTAPQPNGRTAVVVSDHSNHGLPIGATVMFYRWQGDVDMWTLGGEGDEVAIDPRDLKETYTSWSARNAAQYNYGSESYWRYLDEHAQELAAKDPDKADYYMGRSLSESLRGNDGD